MFDHISTLMGSGLLFLYVSRCTAGWGHYMRGIQVEHTILRGERGRVEPYGAGMFLQTNKRLKYALHIESIRKKQRRLTPARKWKNTSRREEDKRCIFHTVVLEGRLGCEFENAGRRKKWTGHFKVGKRNKIQQLLKIKKKNLVKCHRLFRLHWPLNSQSDQSISFWTLLLHSKFWKEGRKL